MLQLREIANDLPNLYGLIANIDFGERDKRSRLFKRSFSRIESN